MLNENRLYSISLGVASLQDGLVGVATALSPAMAGHFKFLLHHFFVRLGLAPRAQWCSRSSSGRLLCSSSPGCSRTAPGWRWDGSLCRSDRSTARQLDGVRAKG